MTEKENILREYLTPETVKVKVKVSDWKEAVKAAGELLLKTGSIEPRYIDAMIKFCEEYNAYIVVAPGIALAHARPENGVKKIGFSLITLEKPVYFGHPENDPVDIVIAFGAVDSSSHIKILAQLAKLLSKSESVEKIRNAKNVKELLDVISQS